MAADADRRQLLGIDGAGTGLRYAFDTCRQPPRVPGDRGPMWGPEHLYPSGTFASGNLPLARAPASQASEAAAWPALLRSIASDIRVPLQITYGDHERLWPIDDASLAELRACSPPRPGWRSRSNAVPATTSASATPPPRLHLVRSPSL